MVHELKSMPEFYEAVFRGIKTFEIRKNDRDFKVGDTLILRAFIPSSGEYSGLELMRRVTYMTDFEQKPGYVVLGIEKI